MIMDSHVKGITHRFFPRCTALCLRFGSGIICPKKKSCVIIITDSYVRAFIAQSSVASSLGAVQCAIELAWDGSHVGDLHYPVTSLFLLVFGAVHCAVELAWDGSMSGTFITQSPASSSWSSVRYIVP